MSPETPSTTPAPATASGTQRGTPPERAAASTFGGSAASGASAGGGATSASGAGGGEGSGSAGRVPLGATFADRPAVVARHQLRVLERPLSDPGPVDEYRRSGGVRGDAERHLLELALLFFQRVELGDGRGRVQVGVELVVGSDAQHARPRRVLLG